MYGGEATTDAIALDMAGFTTVAGSWPLWRFLRDVEDDVSWLPGDVDIWATRDTVTELCNRLDNLIELHDLANRFRRGPAWPARDVCGRGLEA